MLAITLPPAPEKLVELLTPSVAKQCIQERMSQRGLPDRRYLSEYWEVYLGKSVAGGNLFLTPTLALPIAWKRQRLPDLEVYLERSRVVNDHVLEPGLRIEKDGKIQWQVVQVDTERVSSNGMMMLSSRLGFEYIQDLAAQPEAVDWQKYLQKLPDLSRLSLGVLLNTRLDRKNQGPWFQVAATEIVEIRYNQATEKPEWWIWFKNGKGNVLRCFTLDAWNSEDHRHNIICVAETLETDQSFSGKSTEVNSLSYRLARLFAQALTIGKNLDPQTEKILKIIGSSLLIVEIPLLLWLGAPAMVASCLPAWIPLGAQAPVFVQFLSYPGFLAVFIALHIAFLSVEKYLAHEKLDWKQLGIQFSRQLLVITPYILVSLAEQHYPLLLPVLILLPVLVHLGYDLRAMFAPAHKQATVLSEREQGFEAAVPGKNESNCLKPAAANNELSGRSLTGSLPILMRFVKKLFTPGLEIKPGWRGLPFKPMLRMIMQTAIWAYLRLAPIGATKVPGAMPDFSLRLRQLISQDGLDARLQDISEYEIRPMSASSCSAWQRWQHGVLSGDYAREGGKRVIYVSDRLYYQAVNKSAGTIDQFLFDLQVWANALRLRAEEDSEIDFAQGPVLFTLFRSTRWLPHSLNAIWHRMWMRVSASAYFSYILTALKQADQAGHIFASNSRARQLLLAWCLAPSAETQDALLAYIIKERHVLGRRARL